jgi:hypothetical protein
VRTDPITDLRRVVKNYLASKGIAADVTEDQPLGRSVPWRPHLYQAASQTAWYLITHVPESTAWARRMASAREVLPGIELVLCAPWRVIFDPQVLDAADRLNATLLPVEDDGNEYTATRAYPGVSDLIYERNLRLDPQLARVILDRGMERAVDEPNPQRKGVLLEVVAAVMFSQVDGWRVKSGGISRRNQQVDVAVINERVGGILSRGELILAEVKNWTSPPGTVEYQSLHFKMTSSNGFVKMGFLITSDRFTKGVYIDAYRVSSTDLLIVLLDRDSFPAVWRNFPTITEGMEQMVLSAIEDQSQRNIGTEYE